MNRMLSRVMVVILLFSAASIPALADTAVSQDTALAMRLREALISKPESIVIPLADGYQPAGYETVVWHYGAETFHAEVADRRLSISSIRYYPAFAVCGDDVDVYLNLVRFSRKGATDFRLYLSDSLTEKLMADQVRIIDQWLKQARASSCTLSWAPASQCLHMMDVVYATVDTPARTPDRPTEKPTEKPTEAPTEAPEVTLVPLATLIPMKTPAPAPAADELFQQPNGPRAQTLEQFKTALAAHVERLDTQFDMYLEPALYTLVVEDETVWEELLENSGIQRYRYNHEPRLGLFHLSEIEYRKAVRILNAHRSGDTSGLTDRERQTLDEAKRIVSSAPAGILERERFLHDTLCTRITYQTDDESYNEKDQAIGALLNGKADCDGYSEAFYLLSNLAGIPARFQHGDTLAKSDADKDITHMWNQVFINGAWLMIDVTWDDNDDESVCSYFFYNVGSERLGVTHLWNEQAMLSGVDPQGGNAYRPSDIADDYRVVGSDQEALRFVSKMKAEGIQTFCMFFTDAYGQRLYRNDMADYYLLQGQFGLRDKKMVYSKETYRVMITGAVFEDRFAICASDAETLAFIEQMKAQRADSFSLCFAGAYGAPLFAHELRDYHLLEGRFGMASENMTYHAQEQTAHYTDVVFSEHFSVCETEAEIEQFVAQMASRNVTEFSYCVPGSLGARLFANRLEAMNVLLEKTRLTSDRDITYFNSSQVVHVTNAAYWPAINAFSLWELESGVKALLKDRPAKVAVWTDGSYTWDSAHLEALYTSLFRSGITTYRYIAQTHRVEFTELKYQDNFRIVSSEDEIVSFLQECRRQNASSFRVFCPEALYSRLSANHFERFFDLAESIVRNTQVTYNADYYMIGMNDVAYQ